MNVRGAMQRLTLCAGLVVCVLGAQAEVTPLAAQQGPGRRAQLEQRLRDRFAEVIQRRVGLDEAQSDQLLRVLDEYRQERVVLAAETRSLRVKIRNAVASAGDAPVDDADAGAYLAELRDLAQREADLVSAEQDELAEFLTPGQTILIYQLRDQMTERVRQLRNRRGTGPPTG